MLLKHFTVHQCAVFIKPHIYKVQDMIFWILHA